ncbi:MAG TPA: ribosomal-protein-alanine N-acetyltransferase [Clostridiales bacterium]|nr:ribosomal-protein-alanine N-acetyltransferase [Clostridiales bacterium]
MNEIIRIVRSNASHIDGIYEIEKTVFTVPWSKHSLYQDIVENMLAFYVTALSGKQERVAGYGGMWMVEDEAHITNIAVHKDYRRCGVGSAVLNTLIEKCKNNGIRYMSLEVRVSNIIAQQLYQKFGFQAEGIRKRYYSDNHEDAYIMWKYL